MVSHHLETNLEREGEGGKEWREGVEGGSGERDRVEGGIGVRGGNRQALPIMGLKNQSSTCTYQLSLVPSHVHVPRGERFLVTNTFLI